MTSPLTPARTISNSNSPINQRDAWIELDLTCLEKNVQTIKTWLKQNAEQAGVAVPQIMAVVKAAGYGHGAVAIAEVLSACGIAWLAVASADEGIELRKSGCKLPILILSPTPLWAVTTALEQDLDLTISSLNQLNDISHLLADYKKTVRLHLKLDSGMHRLGMNIADAEKAITLLKENKKFKLVSIYSHLAIATDAKTTQKQKENFDRFITVFEKANCCSDFYHLACSEAIKSFPSTYYDFVRIGLYLYGMEAATASSELSPIMSVRARINQINLIDEGESVGYGLTWKASKPTRLANIPIGYADGVDRRLSNKMQGLLHGKFINQVGTISMDQMLFDITDIPQAREGDVITLIGCDDAASSAAKATLYLYDWANELGTMVRELSCRLHMRLPLIYTRGPMLRKLEGK
jgi:alanine racemase